MLRIPYDVLNLFKIDRYSHAPKMNPWADKAYISWTTNAYPDIFARAGYKLKDKLVHKLQVSVIEKGVLLA